MPGILSPLVGWLAGGLSKIFADNVARYIALKAVLATLFITVLPIVLNNFVYALLSIALNHVSSLTPPNLQSVISFDGFAGWLIQILRIPDAFSVLVSCMSYRVALNSIPFVRV